MESILLSLLLKRQKEVVPTDFQDLLKSCDFFFSFLFLFSQHLAPISKAFLREGLKVSCSVTSVLEQQITAQPLSKTLFYILWSFDNDDKFKRA